MISFLGGAFILESPNSLYDDSIDKTVLPYKNLFIPPPDAPPFSFPAPEKSPPPFSAPDHTPPKQSIPLDTKPVYCDLGNNLIDDVDTFSFPSTLPTQHIQVHPETTYLGPPQGIPPQQSQMQVQGIPMHQQPPQSQIQGIPMHQPPQSQIQIQGIPFQQSQFKPPPVGPDFFKT